jgi:hypothetical protein
MHNTSSNKDFNKVINALKKGEKELLEVIRSSGISINVKNKVNHKNLV